MSEKAQLTEPWLLLSAGRTEEVAVLYARRTIVALSFAFVCQSSFASADKVQCDRAPWQTKEISEAHAARIKRGKGAQCLERVTRMTGETVLFEKNKRTSKVLAALARHVSGYYLRVTYSNRFSWKDYQVRAIDPLVLGLADGTELVLYPPCDSRIDSAFSTGWYEANEEELRELSEQELFYMRQFLTSSADVPPGRFVSQTDDGRLYMELVSPRVNEGGSDEQGDPSRALMKLVKCVLPSNVAQTPSAEAKKSEATVSP